jgi:hypothetical protein
MILQNHFLVKIALIFTFIIALFNVFFSFNLTFISPDRSFISLYSDTTNRVTNSAFRIYYESHYQLVTYEYRVNQVYVGPFNSGTQFSDPGIYEFSIINSRGTKLTLEKILDQEQPRISNFRDNRTYRIGEMIHFVDDQSSIKRVEWSRNGSSFQLSNNDAFKFNAAGNYTFRLTDQVDNVAIMSLFVEEGIISTQPDFIFALIFGVIVVLALVGLSGYLIITKRFKGK